MFDNIKNATTFSKGERTAIIILAAVILLIIAANFFMINQKPNVNKNLHNLDSILALHERAIDEMKAKELAEQIERETRENKIKEEREKKKQPRPSKPDFKKVEKKETVVVKKENPIINLNEADTLELLELPEIGAFFARNIVDYREKLGGYIDKEQLLEVYGFDSVRLEIIAPFINIDSVTIRKIRINYDDFKTILRHPYIEYEDVKNIMNHRESRGFIKDWDDFQKVVERKVEERLKRYLEY